MYGEQKTFEAPEMAMHGRQNQVSRNLNLNLEVR